MAMAAKTREAYERWAPLYPPFAHNPLMRAEQSAMLELWPDVRGRRVLDLACGSGRYSRLLMEHRAAQVVAMDDCAAMLADWAGREVLQQVLEVKPPPSMFREGWSVLALVGWWAVQPLLQTARFFVYLDIRTRTEGWDIQTRFAAIAARAEAEPRERRAA